jgi:hypothetical protein
MVTVTTSVLGLPSWVTVTPLDEVKVTLYPVAVPVQELHD